jgi:hypothetical protein
MDRINVILGVVVAVSYVLLQTPYAKAALHQPHYEIYQILVLVQFSTMTHYLPPHNVNLVCRLVKPAQTVLNVPLAKEALDRTPLA